MKQRELGEGYRSAGGLDILVRSLKLCPVGVDSLVIQRSSDGYAEFI